LKRRTDIKILIFLILIGLALFGYLGYRVYNDFFKSKNTHKPIDSIELYEYTLSNNDTSVYKDNFKALSKVLNAKPIDYTEYAKLISKLFIIDLYTLNNKMGSTDIGGVEFLHKDLRDNFKENIGASLYKFMENNLDGKRTQKLPEVKDVTIDNIIESKYTYKNTVYDGYIVDVSWTYVVDLGYETKAKLTLINDKDILYIVKSN
jgi:hypothetical protein